MSCEADREHAEAIIRETGASNLTSLKFPMSKENNEEVRDKTDDIVERRKMGKLGKPLGIERHVTWQRQQQQIGRRW